VVLCRYFLSALAELPSALHVLYRSVSKRLQPANYLRRFLQDDDWDALGGASDATPAPAAPVCT